MGWLDGLSSALTAGTQGAAGYLEGQDKGRLEAQARARQIALDLLAKRKQQEEETMGAANRANLLQDNQLKALQAGYLPVGQLRQEAAQTGGIANTGAAGLSGAANIGSGGIDLSFIQPTVATLAGRRSTELRQGSETPVKLGDQELGFDYNRSTEGRQLQKMQDLQTMKDVEAQRKQTEAASLAAGVADRRNRAAHGTLVQDFKHAQPYNSETDYAAALIDARSLRQLDAGQREKWLTNPTPDADGNFVQTSDRGGFRILNGKQGARPGGAMSGMGQGVQARMLGAVAEARAAMPRMEKMEQQWLDDPSTIPNGAGAMLAKMGTRFSGSHTLTGLGAEQAGESFADPDVLQYMRDAALMARATQLMSSRGGSESMVNSEQLLNRAVPRSEGLRQSVSAAQKSRNAIFGPVGGLMQAFSPAQIAKVEAGLKAIDAGDENGAKAVGAVMDEARAAQSSGGRGGRGNTTATGKSMSAAAYKDARAAGYTDAEIDAQGWKRP